MMALIGFFRVSRRPGYRLLILRFWTGLSVLLFGENCTKDYSDDFGESVPLKPALGSLFCGGCMQVAFGLLGQD